MSNINILASNAAEIQGVTTLEDRSRRRAKGAYFFLLLFTFVLYARPEDYIPELVSIHLPAIVGVCAGICYLFAFLAGEAPVVWTSEIKLGLLLTGWYMLGLPFAYWRTNSLEVLSQVWLKTLFIFFLITQTVFSLNRIRKILWVIILCELVVAAISIFQQSAVVTEKGWRLTGVTLGFLGGNYLGIAAGMTIPYMAVFLVTRRSLLRSSLLVATFGLLMWMLVLTASRSGLLIVTLSIALTWLVILRGSLRSRAIGVSFALLILAAILFSPQVAWKRLATIWGSSNNAEIIDVTAGAEESQAARGQLLYDSIEYTLERPIFGWGIGNFAIVHGNRIGSPGAWMGTHNVFTQISAETGIPALLLFLGLIGVLLRNLRRISRVPSADPRYAESRLLALATIVSILSFMFACFFAHLAYDYYFYYVAGIAVGLQVAAQNLEASRPAQVVEEIPARLEALISGWDS